MLLATSVKQTGLPILLALRYGSVGMMSPNLTITHLVVATEDEHS